MRKISEFQRTFSDSYYTGVGFGSIEILKIEKLYFEKEQVRGKILVKRSPKMNKLTNKFVGKKLQIHQFCYNVHCAWIIAHYVRKICNRTYIAMVLV